MMHETQESISAWIEQTFGTAGSNICVATKANEEMAELLSILAINDQHPLAAEEIADIVILCYRLATRLGVDLHDQVDKKMAVNRTSFWDVAAVGKLPPEWLPFS
jgi:NTP pyrophosphatase (non-canonical NTP hydrolase)